VSEEKIADQGFAADQKLRRQGVPRAGMDTPLRYEFLHAIPVLGAKLEVIIEERRLGIRMEITEPAVLLHCRQKQIARLEETGLRLTERPAVFPIPMGVQDQVHVVSRRAISDC